MNKSVMKTCTKKEKSISEYFYFYFDVSVITDYHPLNKTKEKNWLRLQEWGRQVEVNLMWKQEDW